jgi:hypothetical protein
LWREDHLQLIDVDGHAIRKIDAQLLPGMVSVDFEDTIWGLRQVETGLRLQRFSRDGAKLVEVDLSPGEPVQPPVTLHDGRVLVVTLGRVACVKGGSLLWKLPLLANSRALPDNVGFRGGQDPLVTATANNKILLKQRDRLMLLEDGPEAEWEFVTPDNEPITGNPVISPDGRVCIVCGRRLYFLAP